VVNQTVNHLVKSVQRTLSDSHFFFITDFVWPLNCTNVVYIKRPQIIEHNILLMLYQCYLPMHGLSLHFVWFVIMTWSVSILLWQHDVFMTDNHLHIDIIAVFASDNSSVGRISEWGRG